MKQTTICTLLFAFVYAGPVLAQTPDTTSAERYFPLEVGNVWEYTYDDPFPEQRPHVERREVVGDTLIDEQAWYVWERKKYDLFTSELFWQLRQIVRFDSVSARPLLGASGTPFEACPFNAAFGAEIDCYDDGKPQMEVTGGYGVSITISGQQVSVDSKKGFYPIGPIDIASQSYFADIGPGHILRPFNEYPTLLSYARIGGVEYGAPFPVATEDTPPESAISLTVFPNPGSGDATMRFSLDTPQHVTLGVFDVLGRRVLADDLGVQGAGEAQHRLDMARLPVGVYLVRLTGDAGATATARFVRQ